MSRGMKLLLAGLGSFGIAILIAIKASVWLEEYEAPCDQPFKSIDVVQDPKPRFFDEKQPVRPPVEITLEAKANHPIHAGKPVTLFYRLTLTNRSCLRLSLSHGEWEFDDKWAFPPDESVRNHWQLVFQENTPHRPKFLEWPGPDGIYPLYLYDISLDQAAAFEKKHGLPKDGSGFIRLLPGQSVSTVGSDLKPHLWTQTAWREPGRTVTGLGREAAPIPPGVEAPPAGFRAYRHMVFPAPGRYQLRAEFDQHGLDFDSVRPYYRLVPEFWQWLMSELFGVEASFTSEMLHLKANSNTVTVEVLP